jgi:peroxiredoxin
MELLRTAAVALLGLVLGTVTLTEWRATDKRSAGTLASGQRAPAFALRGDDGRIYRPVASGESPGLIAFFCGCRLCHRAAALMERRLTGIAPGRLFAVMAMNRADVAAFRRETGSTFPILFDAGGYVASAYQSEECPVLWLVDERGRVQFTTRGRTDSPEQWVADLEQRLHPGRAPA